MSQPFEKSIPGNFLVTAVWLVVYFILMAAILLGFYQARISTMRVFNTPETRQSWQQWREDAGKTGGPVARRQPKAAEPPALILLRDMFWTCVISAWIATSVLYLYLMVLLRGMIGKSPRIDYQDPADIASHLGR